MALINCPNCNREISDKAKKCVGCGYQLLSDVCTEETICCPECGAVANSFAEICSNCGYPLNSIQTKVEEKQKSKNLFKMICVWIVPLCLVLLISVFALISNSAKIKNYNFEICSAVDKIMAVSAEVETVGNQICSVWYNAIWEKDNADTAKYTSTARDFDEALSNLFSDEEFINKITAIRNKQTEIDTYLGKLKKPPKKFEDAYEEFIELYYSYSDYSDFVISCKGSYNTYTEDFSKKSSVLMENYREIKVSLLGE